MVTDADVRAWVGSPGSAELNDLGCTISRDEASDDALLVVKWKYLPEGQTIDGALGEEPLSRFKDRATTERLDDGTKTTIIEEQDVGYAIHLLTELDDGTILYVEALEDGGSLTPDDIRTLGENITQAYTS